MWKQRLVCLALAVVAIDVSCAPSVIAADPSTREAIRQMEEGLHAVRPPQSAPWPYAVPSPWWGQYPTACPPGYYCPPATTPQPYWPATPYPPAQPYPPPASYPAAPAYPPAQSQTPYPQTVNPAGRLLILVNPVDAEVQVDGVRLQQLPDLSYEVGLLAGPHQVDVKKEGFKPFSRRLEIMPGGGIYLPVALEK